MTAIEARALTDSARTCSVDPILAKIKAAASTGHESLQLDGVNVLHRDFIIKKLKEMGYTVKHNSGYDQRDRDSWDYLVISW